MNFQGEALPFTFDSGTGTSLLTEVFYETYKDWVDRNGQAKDEQSGGAGGIKTMRVVLLPTINFQSNACWRTPSTIARKVFRVNPSSRPDLLESA